MHNVRSAARAVICIFASFLGVSVLITVLPGCGAASGDGETGEQEYVQTEIFCGRNMPGGGEISEEQFAAFLNDVVTREFPMGMTVYDAYGQMENPDGEIVEQKTKVILLVFEKSSDGGKSVQKVVDAYKKLSNNAQMMITTTDIKPEFLPD
ncbi:MAG: DUF3574 domain-containing protein [Actinobacteria bacterium]|nr:DUF3574 domain-containing protein [Actinomycetota bacterium]